MVRLRCQYNLSSERLFKRHWLSVSQLSYLISLVWITAISGSVFPPEDHLFEGIEPASVQKKAGKNVVESFDVKVQSLQEFRPMGLFA